MNFFRIKLTAFAVACMLISLVGCNVQEATPSLLATEGVNLELVGEVEAMSEPSVQKIVFTQMLSNEEKTYIFKKRIVEKIQEIPLTKEQTDHLNVLLGYLSPDLFDSSSAKARKGVDFIGEWTKQGKVLFNQAVLRDIVASLAPSAGKTKSSTNKMAPPSGPQCNCATPSDWCPDGHACTYIPSCNDRGCGTAWVYTCNGECDRVI